MSGQNHVDLVPPWFQPKSSSVVAGKEEGKPYTLISKELAGWIGMATHAPGRLADTTLTQPH